LEYVDIPKPKPSKNEILVKISACSVCRTDLHVVDGDLKNPKLPLIPGHQIVGRITELGQAVQDLKVGMRVGIPWLGSSCGHCHFCLTKPENLCYEARFTGYQINGGFAEYCVADSHFCFPIPNEYPDLQVRPTSSATCPSSNNLNSTTLPLSCK
jgi:alcohol dehydrogenase, propanol-preferring